MELGGSPSPWRWTEVKLWVLAWQLWFLGKISTSFRDELIAESYTASFGRW